MTALDYIDGGKRDGKRYFLASVRGRGNYCYSFVGYFDGRNMITLYPANLSAASIGKHKISISDVKKERTTI